MITKSKLYLGVALLFVGVISCSCVFAQQTLPSGGSSFETSVLLGPGTYQGSMGEEDVVFYRVQANAGQEIKIETSSSDTWLYLINDQQEELQYSSSEKFVYWLANSEKSTHSFYLKISNEAFAPIESFTLKISLTNRYDANSQTDAGDTFEKALNISTGEYQSYLSGTWPLMTPKGDDFKDYYKVSVKKGATYTFKVTPPSADEISLELLSLDRESIDSKSSANSGAIVSLSLAPTANTDIFVLVEHSGPIAGEVLNYKLNIGTSAALTKFYACKEGSCELAGDFLSSGDCQTATAKACYQTTNCGGKCDIVPPPDGCVKDSDCPAGYPSCINGKCVAGEPPACQDECASLQTKCFDNFNYYKCGDYNKDGCMEWASPVYCGEGNKCGNGKCAPAPGECQCSEWQGTECGASGCPQDQVAKTRTCTPAACDIEKTCQDDLSCQVIPPPDGCSLGFLSKVFPGLCNISIISKLPFLALFGGVYMLFWIIFYIYLAICLQVLAKKTGTKNGWMAWIPIADIFLMINIANKPLWWFVLLLIPIVNIVIGIVLWMAIAERRGKENWIGVLIIVPVVGIVIPGYLAFSEKKKTEKIESTPPNASTGTQEANKPTVGYKHACKYCEKLIPPDSATCPFCEKANPLGPFRCPKCHEPIEKNWKVCPKCNQNLRIVCPYCEKVTFFGDHCEDCDAKLLVNCPSCDQEQPPLSDKCIKCGKSMDKNKDQS